MTILVYLSNTLLREALEEQMRRDPAGWQAISCNEAARFACVKPELVVVDASNLEHEIFTRWPDAKFILLDTGVPLEEMVRMLCIYRLDGIISTDTDFMLFKRAVQVVLDGQVWIDNEKLKALLRSKAARSGKSVIERLTDREKQIMEKIVAGCRNREIADRLCICEQTVKSHINRIFSKLGVKSRSQLVSLFVKNNGIEK